MGKSKSLFFLSVVMVIEFWRIWDLRFGDLFLFFKFMKNYDLSNAPSSQHATIPLKHKLSKRSFLGLQTFLLSLTCHKQFC